MLARLVLIGDVHTEATRLAHAARTGPDAVLCMGDVVDGPEDVGRCIALLREHGWRRCAATTSGGCWRGTWRRV